MAIGEGRLRGIFCRVEANFFLPFLRSGEQQWQTVYA
jgi:hypothetical protein